MMLRLLLRCFDEVDRAQFDSNEWCLRLFSMRLESV